MKKHGMLTACILGILLTLILVVPGVAYPEFVTLKTLGESREDATLLEAGELYYIDFDVIFDPMYNSNSWLKFKPQKTGTYYISYYVPSGWVSFDVETQYKENMLHGDAGSLTNDPWMTRELHLDKGEVYFIDFHFSGTVHFAICAPDNHTGEGTRQIVTATCTEAGAEKNCCEICGTVLRQKAIPAKGHVPSEMAVIQEATCIQEGTKAIMCLTCGEILESTSIPLVEHTPSTMTPVVSASCLQTGRLEQWCLVCGTTLYSEEIPALGHEYTEWEVLYEPTKTAEGERQRHCVRCGDTQQEKIPKLHKFLGLF